MECAFLVVNELFHLPELGADLVAALAGLDVKELTY